MKGGISSYLSIFDDWNLLKPSLWSVMDRVDEIVVVDGAYEWMAPAFTAFGRDARRSKIEVYDVLSSFGKKVRIINGLWKNESQKRQAGYEACTNRYIVRHDADEILLWDDHALGRFFGSGRAVGQVEMPIYASPGIIRAKSADAPIEKQSILFDREKVNSFQHLSYLWLVLPPEEATRLDPLNRELIFGEPIAYNAHLTLWRPPETSINRARFYVLNYIRSAGRLPWLPEFKYESEDDFRKLFEIISPNDFDDFLLGTKIVAAPVETDSWVLRPSPRSFSEETSFSLLHDLMIAGLSRINDTLSVRPRTFVNGQQYTIDASAGRSLSGILHNGRISFRSDQRLRGAQVKLVALGEDGSTSTTRIPVDLAGDRFAFEMPLTETSDGPIQIRRSLEVTVSSEADCRLLKIQAIT